ncbi:MAG TPA: M28 family peptidase [Arenimonas sp.]|nr:M28 family peptidase [Arenimonas sp.]
MRLLSLAILFSLSTIACANDTGLTNQALTNAKNLREQAVQGSNAYSIVESLTTEVGPRMGGSDAYDRATLWAQEKFKTLGFDKVWLQPVTFPVWQRRSESGRIISPFPQPLILTALGGSVGTQGSLTSEVVGFATLDALKAAPENSLKGKIAFVNLKMIRAKDGSGYGPASTLRRNGAAEAAKKGALAIVIRSVGTDTDRMPHTGMMRYDETIAKIPAAALSAPDADLLANMLRRGKPVKLELNIDAGFNGSKTEYSVIGEITGRSKPDEVVVIGGHLDSWDLGTGAIDDGAGVAITMAAGALIGKLKEAPQRTIRVIAFANEEQGLLGGTAYAEAMKSHVSKHQIGAESDFGAGRIYALQAGVNKNSWPVIEQIGKILEPLGIAIDKVNGGPGPDIGAMAAQGMPWAELSQDGTDYFDYHHTANDTLDKIDPKALDQQVAAYAVFAYLAAETDMDFEPAEKK